MRVLLQKHVEPAVTRNSARPGAEISPLWTLGSTRTPQRTRQREAPTSSRAERAVFVLLLTIIGAAAVPIGSIDPWWSGIFEAVIFLIGACALIATIGKSWELPLVLAPFAALVLVACLQVIPSYVKAFPASYQILSLNPFETGRFAIRLGAVGLTLALLLRFTKTRSQLLKLAQLVIFVGVASAVLAIWRRMFPDNTLAALWNSKDGDFGQFTNRNHFTLLMEMCLGPTLSLAFYSHGPRRFLYFDIALLLSLALLLVNSRGGVISMIAQLAFMSWIYFSATFASSLMEQTSTTSCMESRAQQFWRIAQGVTVRSLLIRLVLVTFSAGVVWLGGESVRERLESVPGELVPRSGPLENVNPRRLEIWTATWKLIKAHPFMGSGIGAYKTAISQYLNSGGSWEPQQAHNEYLELTAGSGIVGAAIGVWFITILIRQSRKRLRHRNSLRKAICQGALVGLVGVAVHSLVDFGLHVIINTLICCCLITLAIAKVSCYPVES